MLTLEQFKARNYGKRGTQKRDQLEAGYEKFKIGVLIHEARLEKGLTKKAPEKAIIPELPINKPNPHYLISETLPVRLCVCPL